MYRDREASNAPTTVPKAKTILIVEDNEAIGQMLVQILSLETPYKVRLVMDALEALKAVQEFKPHLLLLDYYLPYMTGIQLYDHLHQKEELKSVPAVILSANLPMHELRRRQLVGLGKPFDLDKLLNVIDHYLGESTSSQAC